MTLTITLPNDRELLGHASIGVLVFPCLGKADNSIAALHHNPKRDPLLPFGDTPLGIFTGTVIPPGADTAGYGPGPRILLSPVSGDCVKAEHNGRAGLLCHAGDPNPDYVQWQGLRPTEGCVRFKDEDMATLMGIVGAGPIEVVIQSSTPAVPVVS